VSRAIDTRRLAAVGLLPPALCLALLAGAGLQDGGQDPAAGHGDEPRSELGRHMLVIEEELGRLRRALRDERERPQALLHIVAIERAALAAKDEAPLMAATRPEAARAAFVAAYRKEMIVLLSRLLALETAVLDGDGEAAKLLFEEIREMEDSGHERFTEEG